MKKLRLFIATLLLGIPLLVPMGVSAQFNPIETPCEQLPNPETSEICAPAGSDDDLVTGSKSIFIVVADILTIAAGVIAVIMVIISGISMITSSGDSGKVKKARDTIIYTVIGIFVVLLSRAIVIFIVGSLG